MKKSEAKQLQDALQTQRRCANRLMYPEREAFVDLDGKTKWRATENYAEADLWVTAQKVIEAIVHP